MSFWAFERFIPALVWRPKSLTGCESGVQRSGSGVREANVLPKAGADVTGGWDPATEEDWGFGEFYGLEHSCWHVPAQLSLVAFHVRV